MKNQNTILMSRNGLLKKQTSVSFIKKVEESFESHSVKKVSETKGSKILFWKYPRTKPALVKDVTLFVQCHCGRRFTMSYAPQSCYDLECPYCRRANTNSRLSLKKLLTVRTRTLDTNESKLMKMVWEEYKQAKGLSDADRKNYAVHHIHPFAKFPEFRGKKSNLIVLSNEVHTLVHKNKVGTRAEISKLQKQFEKGLLSVL